MSRTLAIGDIHGCFVALKTLVDLIGIQSSDVLVTLGDYCDRGPNTYAVIDFLIHLKAHCLLKPLRGNHDIMMLAARNDESEVQKWLDVGGKTTLASYAPFSGDAGKLTDVPSSHWNFLTHDLLPYFESEKHFFVHANAYPEIPLEDQPENMLYWEQYHDPPLHQNGKTMVCGHTSQKSGMPVFNGNAICIDTWPVGKGWLTCLDVSANKIWQANETGNVREFWLDEI